MKRLDMHYWRAGYSESCTVSSVGGRRKRAKQLVPRRRPTQLNLGSKAREVGSESFEWFSHWVPSPGTSWQGQMECFAGKASRLLASVLMHWEPGYESAWIIVTDLDPEHAHIAWYRLRTWIEGGFKDFKRGLWGWHHSKMERASCVERLWLAMALAQL